MPVDLIHVVMGTMYLVTWAFIGQVAIRRQSSSDSDRLSQTP